MTRLLLPMKTCRTRVDESDLPGAKNVIVCVTLVLRDFDKRFRSHYPNCVFGYMKGLCHVVCSDSTQRSENYIIKRDSRL